MPKNTVGTHSPLLGLTAHCWDSQPIVRTHSPLSVLRSIVSTQTHCRCSSPTVGTQAHCWDSQPIVGTHSPLLGLTAHCRCSGPLSIRRSIVSTQTPQSVLRSIVSTQTPQSVLRSIVGAQAPQSVLRSIVGAPTEKPRAGVQHHARLGPTRGCRRRQTASASLRLLAAPDPGVRGCARGRKPQSTRGRRRVSLPPRLPRM